MTATLGFACVWDSDRASTWSHIPLNLLTALQALAPVEELRVGDRRPLQRLREAHNRRCGQPLWVPRSYNDIARRWTLNQAARAVDVERVLEINELARVRRPYWVYRDMTWSQVKEYGGDSATGVVRPSLVRTRERHERAVLGGAEGVFTFSRWAAAAVARLTTAQTVVVEPGVNVRATARRDLHRTPSRLLFIGRAFERKGGPETVEAFRLLRAENRHVTLTVAGPGHWPLPGPVPEGVTFLGDAAPATLVDVLRDSDLFVLPTHFDAYGIAFVEALAAGLPCVARSVCAVPEIVTPERGRLVLGTGVEELATAIDSALNDEGLHKDVVARAADVAAHYTWDRAARQMVAAIAMAADAA